MKHMELHDRIKMHKAHGGLVKDDLEQCKMCALGDGDMPTYDKYALDDFREQSSKQLTFADALRQKKQGKK